MSDVISKLRRLGFGGNDNQQQSQQVNQAQVGGQVDVPSQLPGQGQPVTSRLDRLVPAGNPKLRAMVEEVRGFSIIERAILARVLFENDEVVNKIKPEDWIALIRDKIGEEYAEVFRAWLEGRGIKVEKQ
ncbi:hypothetical protein B7L70_03435 [Vulcanisaeta sp. EB80]|uniref:hypothetical protein n=1 Tax=Vulcanisaeta sp. EB80 TaxID=1650660 RepID=UPI0009C16358|nr:hypothetical protein [Vulcanisaeta sp. EB80]PLC68430.1 hypothetical protein B7L70_03435 [Vulcanisaeta sp. EB80]